MKKIPLFLALLGLTAGTLTVHSQAPAPVVPVVPVPVIPVVPATVPGTPAAVIAQLQAIRDQNAKLIEQQTATLKLLEEMEKTAQQIKLFGKRS